MNFNKHFDLEGKHAMLSASSWRWINDDEEALTKRLCGIYSTTVGTILHEIAYDHIKYRIKMNKYDKKNVVLKLLSSGVPGMIIDNLDIDSIFDNLMAYVNDGIGYKMTPEVILCHGNFFGTTDAINFSEDDRFLRIHDYKSGATPAHIEQLIIYAALFCLEYRIKPSSISSELRIYQAGEIVFHNPVPEEIDSFCNKILEFDKFMTHMKEV